MALVSMPDCPPGDTGTTQPSEMPSVATSSSPSPSRERDLSTGDLATGEALQSQAPRSSTVSLATTTSPATEPPNPETGYPPPTQTPDAIRNMAPAGPSAASPAALFEPPNMGTGHPPPQAPGPIEPTPQVAIDVVVIPRDAQVEEAQQQQPARLDEEAQRPWPERLGSWCRVAWTCHETVTFMVAVVVGFIAIVGVIWEIAHTLNNRGTSMPTNRQ